MWDITTILKGRASTADNISTEDARDRKSSIFVYDANDKQSGGRRGESIKLSAKSKAQKNPGRPSKCHFKREAPGWTSARASQFDWERRRDEQSSHLVGSALLPHQRPTLYSHEWWQRRPGVNSVRACNKCPYPAAGVLCASLGAAFFTVSSWSHCKTAWINSFYCSLKLEIPRETVQTARIHTRKRGICVQVYRASIFRR